MDLSLAPRSYVHDAFAGRGAFFSASVLPW